MNDFPLSTLALRKADNRSMKRTYVPHETSPAGCAAEARIFAEAGLRMLTHGECAQAARLFARAAAFAERAA